MTTIFVIDDKYTLSYLDLSSTYLSRFGNKEYIDNIGDYYYYYLQRKDLKTKRFVGLWEDDHEAYMFRHVCRDLHLLSPKCFRSSVAEHFEQLFELYVTVNPMVVGSIPTGSDYRANT